MLNREDPGCLRIAVEPLIEQKIKYWVDSYTFAVSSSTEKWELLRGVNCWKKNFITKSQENSQNFWRIDNWSAQTIWNFRKRQCELANTIKVPVDFLMIICLTAGVDLSDETSRRNFDKCQKMKRYSKCRNEYKLICLYAHLFLCTSSVCKYPWISIYISLSFLKILFRFFYVKGIWNSLNSWNRNLMFVVWIDRI